MAFASPGRVLLRQADWGAEVKLVPSPGCYAADTISAVVPANAGTHTPRPRYFTLGLVVSNQPKTVVMGPCVRRDDAWGLRPRRGHAAVNHDGLPGHETRRIGAEIGDRAGDFVGFADTAQG